MPAASSLCGVWPKLYIRHFRDETQSSRNGGVFQITLRQPSNSEAGSGCCSGTTDVIWLHGPHL
jgi:hypothetical protein